MRLIFFILLGGLVAFCSQPARENEQKSEGKLVAENPQKIKPKYITPKLPNDSDDPAIWYNEKSPENSLILGTDKEEETGGLYIFNIKGELDSSKTVYPLKRPNNVDVAYSLPLGQDTVDIAVVSERMTASIRVFSVPDMETIDGGGIPVFEDDSANEVMGIALYTRPEDNAIFAIVSRKENSDHQNDYLYQYKLNGENGTVTGKLVRKFGDFSGQGEIEAIAVDNEHGFVYYSDELYGIRKYYADPEKGNEELGVFGTSDFTDDREGIAIFKNDDGSGYITVSDQAADKFRVYTRKGRNSPHNHVELAVLDLSTLESDGSEIFSKSLGPDFPNGLFVAMSDNGTFEIYDWNDLQKKISISQ